MHAEPISLLVCGPLLWDADPAHLSRVRSALVHTPQLEALRRAVTELPEVWALLVATEPSLERLHAAPLLQGFAEWITSGNPSDLLAAGHGSKNAQLAVLTVLSHLTEYAALLSSYTTTREHGWGDGHAKTLQGLHEAGIQGLCVGLLSASAVACARSLTEVAELGAVAVRLSVCAAVFVDLDQTESVDPAVCISARFSRAAAERLEDCEPFEETLQKYPQAYMGVRMDVASATVTATKSTAESLTRHLRDRGATAKEINVRGRFHYPGHDNALRTLVRMCAATPMLQFPNDKRPLVPLRGNSGGDVVTPDEMPLHETMLRSILTDPADWHTTMATAVAALDESTVTEPRLLVQLGPVDCVPRSVLGAGSVRVLQATAAVEDTGRGYPDGAVAVIGMSCQFPDAETPDRFWDVIRAGRTATDSFPDAAAFDCGLFQKSPREAEYMDPQHRLGLHLAYEALESGGYFSPSSSSTTDVGCFVGMSSCDYEDHVNARPPTAFSYTGTARAFSSGRISHFFGLTGPSMVVDTACSSSGVAIHSACRAILSGECAMALAGGVSLMTAEGQAHQNLAGASFLSPTGQCRPFDAGADGYRRGQGGGFVLLKRLSTAVADNDDILGVLASSATNSCKGTRSITLPSSESQSSLYERVLRLADLRPRDVSYVEAHGTGTKKGDPIECQSIRAVFGRDRCRSRSGSSSSRPLRLGSVKATFGHAEAASGIASLSKVLLMLRHRLITPQANFDTLNPAIPPLEADDMEVAVEAAPWEGPWRAALVNNYGASGTNAAVVVCQPPQTSSSAERALSAPAASATPRRFPFLITAHTDTALRRNCRALLRFLEARPGGFCDKDLASFAFHLAQRQNQALTHRAVFSAGSSAELAAHLGALAEAKGGDAGDHVVARHPKTDPPRPVVLLFSGQTGRRAHLDRGAYLASRLLRRHLDRCDRALQSLGLGSLLPRIFDAEPVEDLVQLHCMQFALQYSTAAAWIDSGLEVKALLGHSLGQLTALCVGGVLSLGDALRLVSGRASLVQTKWMGERGCMLSVDADVATVEAIASSSSSDSGEDGGAGVEIACYNASHHQVVAGTERAVAAFEGAAASRGVSTRRLAVTHAFHSRMVEDILPDYHRLLQGLVFHPATIPIEPCSELAGSWDNVTPELVARQSREPVYFAQAVSRVQERLGGSCIWLEAGPGSAAVTMARRALDGQTSSHGVQSHSFHAAQLHGTDSISHLADTSLGLWSKGVRVQFWLYHALQRCSFVPMNLPSYQFDKTQHWLAPITRHGGGSEVAGKEQPRSPSAAPELVSLVGGGVGALDARAANEFTINQDSREYLLFVQGRTVFGQILAPGSVFAESAARAVALLLPSHAVSADLSVPPSVELARMKLHAPFGLDPQRRLRLTLQTQTASSWDFVVESVPLQENAAKSAKLQASGTVRLQAPQASSFSFLSAGQTLLGRLHDRCNELRGDPDASVVQGAFVKKILGRVAKYDDAYFAIRSIASRGLEAVGDVGVLPIMSRCPVGAALSPPAFDNFLLVAELHAGSLGDLADDHLYICGGFDAIVPHASPGGPSSPPASGPWTVLSTLERRDDKTVACDILVFDAHTKTLFLSILGARLAQVPARSLQRVLEETNAAGPADDGKKEASITDETPHVGGDWTGGPSWFGSSAVDAHAASLGIMDHRHAPTGLASKTIYDDLPSSLSPPLGSDTSLYPPSSDNRDNRKGSSSGFSPSTPASSATTTTTPTSDRDQGNPALYMLLSEHLDLSNGIPPDMPLGNIGLDSLVAIQIQSDMEELFGKSPRLKSIDENSTYADLCGMVEQQHLSTRPEPKPSPVNSRDAGTTSDGLLPIDHGPAVAPSRVLLQGAPAPFISLAVREFNRVKDHTAVFARQTGFADFYSGGVYQKQTALVLAYVLEAFGALGCDLKTLRADDPLPPMSYQPKHRRLMERLHGILEEAGLVSPPGDGLLRRRTDAPLPEAVPAADLYRQILAECPLYQPDHRLLNVTASRLADCLSGRADPLQLLFQDRASLKLLEDVYISSPMFSTGNSMLGAVLGGLLSHLRFARGSGGSAEKLRVLEIGAGTGATTRRVMDQLLASDVDFTYTFTDISPALVNGSKKKFGEIYGRRRVASDMEFATLDIEKPPPASMLRSYHLVVSSNCVHATRDLRLACTNIESLLRRDGGMLCLLELTRPLGWLDCVFGLLDGWWRFDDGRTHALAHEDHWKTVLQGAGFGNVDWTDDGSRESQHFRLITAWHSVEQ